MKKILIADDSQFMRNTVRKIVTTAGFEVVGEATNGLEAVRLNEELNPDLITLDITMPEMDGIGAIENIRKTDKEVKVIMCSAIGQDYYINDALGFGANEFIVKPFKAPTLLQAIEKVFSETPVS